MAKQSGVGWTTLTVADAAAAAQVIKNDVTNLTISTPRSVQDITGVDKSAIERLLLLADMSLTLNGVFNPSATFSHAVFSSVPSTSVARAFTLTVNGVSLGTTNSPTLLFTDYQLARPAGGELTWSAPGVLANGAVPAWS